MRWSAQVGVFDRMAAISFVAVDGLCRARNGRARGFPRKHLAAVDGADAFEEAAHWAA